MKIRLDQLGERPFTWRETLSLDDDLSVTDGSRLVVSPVECRGSLDPTTSGFVFRAHIRYRQTMACSRCLEDWSEEVDSEIGLLLDIDATGSESAEELSREDLGVQVLAEPDFDSRPAVLEQVQLGVPMKPLCRPDCAGLCSRCGKDLNQGPCQCQADVDPRWAALSALRGGGSGAGDAR